MSLPQGDSSNLFVNKIVIFIALFILQIIYLVIVKLAKISKYSFKHMLNDSLYVGIIGVIGYSIFIDFILYNDSKQFMGFPIITKYNASLFISSIIAFSFLVFKTLQLLIFSQDIQ